MTINTNQVKINGIALKEAVCNTTVIELVLGFISLEFPNRFEAIPSGEIFRRVGCKLSIDRKTVRACLLVLEEAGLIDFVMIGHEPHIRIKRCP